MYKHRLRELCREAAFPVMDFGDDHFVLTQHNIGDLRELSYFDQWKRSLSMRWYHIKMQDHSVFIFSEGLKPSYSYLHAPIDAMTFPKYLQSIGEQDTPSARARLRSDYEQAIDTSVERKHVTPIRFDYDPGSYRAGVHPAGHIHIGLDNDIRIAVNKMSVMSFTLFVMRQMYPQAWERLLTRSKLNRFVRSIRDSSTDISPEHWTDMDRIELHLA